MDAIVIDFFHWTRQGDFKFEPRDWPDPEAMVKELKEMGIETVVSVWPTIDERSENFGTMSEMGYLVNADRGNQNHMTWMGNTVFYDATHPGAQKFVWEKCKENYYKKGIRCFWLDEAEPEYGPYDFDNYRYYAGPALQCSNVYPVGYAKGFYEGLKAEGEKDILSLVRCAWAGSQKSFNPIRFQPEEWAQTAKDCGFKYLILTTKHHDGFCLWDTRYSDYKVTAPDCPYHVSEHADLVKSMFDAFREKGLGIGAYFSKADWHTPYYRTPELPDPNPSDRGPMYSPAAEPERWENFVQYTKTRSWSSAKVTDPLTSSGLTPDGSAQVTVRISAWVRLWTKPGKFSPASFRWTPWTACRAWANGLRFTAKRFMAPVSAHLISPGIFPLPGRAMRFTLSGCSPSPRKRLIPSCLFLTPAGSPR